MKAAEFDRIFDDGEEDIIEYLDLSKIRRPGLENKSVCKKLQYLHSRRPSEFVNAISLRMYRRSVKSKIRKTY